YTNTFVKKALEYINENYSDVNLSIVDISNHCIVNTHYLCRIFKNTTGETINHYVNKLRISKAKKL
ncbi:MAG: AraC family transcriptional regulator, partial [Christensenellales bacterium]